MEIDSGSGESYSTTPSCSNAPSSSCATLSNPLVSTTSVPPVTFAQIALPPTVVSQEPAQPACALAPAPHPPFAPSVVNTSVPPPYSQSAVENTKVGFRDY